MHFPHKAKGAMELSGASFNKGTNPIKVSSWRPNHLPKSPPPNTELSSWRLDFNIWILRCHKHTKHSKHLGLTQASETVLWIDFTETARKWSCFPHSSSHFFSGLCHTRSSPTLNHVCVVLVQAKWKVLGTIKDESDGNLALKELSLIGEKRHNKWSQKAEK